MVYSFPAQIKKSALGNIFLFGGEKLTKICLVSNIFYLTVKNLVKSVEVQ
jgi:hypothetical protein